MTRACSSGDSEAAAYFETVAKGRDAKQAANWVTQELFGALNKNGLELRASPVKAEALGALLDLIKDGTINGKIAKDVFAKMMETGDAPGAIVEREGLSSHRYRRDRESHRRADGGQRRQGRRREEEPESVRLVGWSDDEGHRRQGQPGGGE